MKSPEGECEGGKRASLHVPLGREEARLPVMVMGRPPRKRSLSWGSLPHRVGSRA